MRESVPGGAGWHIVSRRGEKSGIPADGILNRRIDPMQDEITTGIAVVPKIRALSAEDPFTKACRRSIT